MLCGSTGGKPAAGDFAKEKAMRIEKLVVDSPTVIPLMAALPYSVVFEGEAPEEHVYDPISQITRFAGRNFSTCREDESAGGFFQSKSDTKKDD